MNRTPFVVLAAVLLIAAAGCEEDDERLARFAEESVRQQAGQNRHTSQLNREVVRAQQELVALQHDLGEQQAEVNHQRDRLESERRERATQRRRDPIIAAAIRSVGLALACLAPLTLAGYLLYQRQTGSADPSSYLIRVNRQPCSADKVLQEGDRISITPTKIEGAHH